jgi:ABC-type branched-subunit amino acid transport system ATPase component
MLKNVRIQNFRSCRDVTISDMGSVLALVGKNGAGKTNILNGIAWFARNATMPGSPTLWEGPFFRGNSPVVTADIVTHPGPLYRYTFGMVVEPARGRMLETGASFTITPVESLTLLDERASKPQEIFSRNRDEVFLKTTGKTVKIGEAASGLFGLTFNLPADDPTIPHVRSVLSYLNRVRYYAIAESPDPRRFLENQSIIQQESYKEWLARYNETGIPGDSVPMRILHMFLESKNGQFKELSSLLGNNGLGIIDKIEVNLARLASRANEPSSEQVRLFYYLQFRPAESSSDSRGLFDYSDLSLGTRRVVSILVSMIFDGSTVMLLEHPEDGIHTGLVRKLTSLLSTNADPTQVIMASHSSTVLNTLKPSDIRLVVMHDGQTIVRPLREKEINIAAKYIAEDGNLFSFLSAVQGE